VRGYCATKIVDAGTYTPTISSTTNVTSSTARQSFYKRIGNIVTVSGVITMYVTANAYTELTISLPIASAIATQYEVTGSGIVWVSGAPQVSTLITSNIASDAAMMYFEPGGSVPGASRDFQYTFTYIIL